MGRNYTLLSLVLILASVLLSSIVVVLCDTHKTLPYPHSYPDIPDISDAKLDNIVRFKLDRTELSSAQLEERAAWRPYSIQEERTATVSYGRAVFPVALTEIPKHIGYTATFAIGTYPDSVSASSASSLAPSTSYQLFNLLIDTGSDLLVVTSTSANDPESVQVRNRYDCAASTTSSPTKNLLTGGRRWVQRYGDGTIGNGTLIQDTVRFVSSSFSDAPTTSTATSTAATIIQIDNQSMLVVDQPGLHLTKSYGLGVDGIIGLNLRSSIISSTVIQSLQRVESAVAATTTTASPSATASTGIGFMSLWLTKSLEMGRGGELLLNAVDKSRFKEPIRWSDRGPSPYDWSVPLDRGILLNLINPVTSATSSITGKGAVEVVMKSIPETDHTFAVLDSGSDGIYLTQSAYNALFSMVPGSQQLRNGYWRVPCEGTTELVFGIEGMLYRIPYQDWVRSNNETVSTVMKAGPGMCQSRVYGSSPGPILLGSVFLRSVYTVFDFSIPGYERMGFAALK
ncbi:hypothetical protein EDD11_010114 [Mortierella claussenii]|nr:hypothetical protein EDD11_010114 [Mortierella claussenii]